MHIPQIKKIEGKYCIVESVSGDLFIQEQLCDVLGHAVAVEQIIKTTIVIQKGVCSRCGKGDRHWELSDKQVKQYENQLRSYR